MKKIAVLTSLILLPSIASFAQEQNDCPPSYSMISKNEIEYLVPTKNGNPIKTLSAHLFLWKRTLKKATFYIKAGITSTYAWGHSRQWYPISDNVWQAYDYETSAFGLGPVVEFENRLIRTDYFDITAEASAGCIRYNTHFPYGGDVYNFMLRTGPSIAFSPNKNFSIEIGYRWMHVSNGQGSGNFNPFYEAQGINLCLNFKK